MPATTAIDLLKSLHSRKEGLNADEVSQLQTSVGFNEFPERKQPLWLLLVGQLNDIMVYILLAAVAVSLIVPLLHGGEAEASEFVNAIVILLIVLLNAILGFLQEWRAENAIASLRKLSAPQARVRRGGVVLMIPSRELVPGDVMLIEAGDKLSADGTLFASASLEIDESSLTGESVPVAKNLGKEGLSGVFAGTIVSRGAGEMVVTATGIRTEIGKISSMVMSLKPPPTPLQLQLKTVGSRIGIIVLGLCAVIFFLGLLEGRPAVDVFFTAVSLAVAAVPEGLPAIVTVCLAIGVQRMIRKNALVRRLDAVETLGNVNVICADKTGTMTQNRMEVVDSWVADGQSLEKLAQAGASCNTSALPAVGDPTEIALLHFATKNNVERLTIDEQEVPFTSEEKYMITRHTSDGKTVRYAKGAPEVITNMTKQSDQALKKNAEMASKGLRVLALAEDSGSGLVLIGMVAMLDPPRPEVEGAIETARIAGIRTIMITGDHPVTALQIAKNVGIRSEGVLEGPQIEQMNTEQLQHALRTVSVFARVRPVHKVKILEALQLNGDVVAMSGDGVNDAPALKRAHVGIAMGKNGTDVARESAAMVLTDDNFATIVAAIREGRRIYDNIRKFIVFLLRSNVGEVLVVSSAMLMGMPLPLLPLHILWINLVTDSLPALALAAEKAESGIMERPPRSLHQGILSGEMPLMFIAGILNMILGVGIFMYSLHLFPDRLDIARTCVLTTTILYQLLLSFSTRVRGVAFLEAPFGNPWLIGAILASVGLQMLLLFTPLSTIFMVAVPPAHLWKVLIASCIAGFAIFELAKLVLRPHTERRQLALANA